MYVYMYVYYIGMEGKQRRPIYKNRKEEGFRIGGLQAPLANGAMKFVRWEFTENF